MLYL
ncbi:hypothetical protein PENPOL_c002G06471 [Penicillium polonicum]|jgi:hypothetical protein